MRTETQLRGFERAFEYSQEFKKNGGRQDQVEEIRKAFLDGWNELRSFYVSRKKGKKLSNDAFLRSVRNNGPNTPIGLVSNALFYSPVAVANKKFGAEVARELLRQPLKEIAPETVVVEGISRLDERRSICKILCRKYRLEHPILRKFSQKATPLSEKQIDFAMRIISDIKDAQKEFSK